MNFFKIIFYMIAEAVVKVLQIAELGLLIAVGYYKQITKVFLW